MEGSWFLHVPRDQATLKYVLDRYDGLHKKSYCGAINGNPAGPECKIANWDIITLMPRLQDYRKVDLEECVRRGKAAQVKKNEPVKQAPPTEKKLRAFSYEINTPYSGTSVTKGFQVLKGDEDTAYMTIRDFIVRQSFISEAFSYTVNGDSNVTDTHNLYDNDKLVATLKGAEDLIPYFLIYKDECSENRMQRVCHKGTSWAREISTVLLRQGRTVTYLSVNGVKTTYIGLDDIIQAGDVIKLETTGPS
jgi:hypothetical protein